MPVFVDTSGIFAVMDRGDRYNAKAEGEWEALMSGDDALVTSSYVVVETTALVQRRLGFAAARDFLANVVSALEVYRIDEQVHSQAVSALLAAGERDLSLVDCVSFKVMRRFGDTIFTFDVHFAQRGFRCVPD